MLLPLLSQGQASNINPLTIGDTVPGMEITNLYNYPASSIHLPLLSSKLVILDFWATWCGSCIEAFPKMQHLQEKFGSKLQVILVNTYKGDTIQKVQAFFERYRRNTGHSISLPYSLSQEGLMAYFPYKFIPHYVWINKGRLVAITSQDEVTAENISAFTSGNTISLYRKSDDLAFDTNKPLFLSGNGGDGNNFKYRSIITGYIEGIGYNSGMQQDNAGKIIRFYMYNTSASLMLQAAWPALMNRPASRIILNLKNPAKFMQGATAGALVRINSYCYETIIPPSSPAELQQYLQEDVSKFFSIRVCSQIRLMKCLVIRKKTGTGKKFTKPAVNQGSVDGNKIINQPGADFIDILNSLPALAKMPVINETGIVKDINLELPADFHDTSITALKRFLQQNGFETSEAGRRIAVTVVSDK